MSFDPCEEPVELTFEWAAHGRPLNLSAVDPTDLRDPRSLPQALWAEVESVAEQLGLESAADFRAISVEWNTSEGRGCSRVDVDSGGDRVALERDFLTRVRRDLEQRPLARRLDALR